MRSFKSEQIPPPPFSIFWPKPSEYPQRALEIGAGNGEFSLQYSLNHPDCFLLSLERTKNKSDQFKTRSQPKNLYFIRADAINVVTHCVSNQSLDQIFLLYPNPYPKKSQANQRWHNMPFMQALVQKLKPHGTLELRTNILNYFEEAKLKMPFIPNLELSLEEELHDSKKASTAFERKYLLRGETCYRALFSCTRTEDEREFPPPKTD